jgi:hypothetical protein
MLETMRKQDLPKRVAVTPGRASGDEELALNAGTAISEFAKSVTAITGSG